MAVVADLPRLDEIANSIRSARHTNRQSELW